MKGIFETKELFDAFRGPIGSIAKVLPEEGIVLNVKTDKTMGIYSLDKAGVMVHVNYNDILTNFVVSKDEKIGILSPRALCSQMALVSVDKLAYEFDSTNNVLTFITPDQEGGLELKTAEVSMITEASRTCKVTSWVAEVLVSPKWNRFIKSCSILSSEDCVVIHGDKTAGTITMSVQSSAVRMNSFKLEVSAKVDADFNTVYSKELFEKVMNTPADTMTVSFSERMIKVACKSKHSDITYYVAKKA